MEEAKIIINGNELGVGASMAIRVAIENFAVAWAKSEYGDKWQEHTDLREKL